MSGTMKKRGRKPLDPERRLDQRVSVLLRRPEKARLEEHARSLNLTMNEMIRMALEAFAPLSEGL